jgi:nucleoside phosphorylase
MTLTASQRKQLTDALLDAFDNGGLERLASFGLDKNLDAIAGGKNLTEKVFNLVRWAQANDKVDQLINAASEENPGNRMLREFARALKSTKSQTPSALQTAAPPRALFLTALQVESQAVRSFISDLQEEVHEKGTVYTKGIFRGSNQVWEVIVAETGSGNVEAGLETERAINHYDPVVIFFVGVAGGVKDVALGDVVAATKVYSYESGAATTVFQPRPRLGESSYLLEQRARAEAGKGDWKLRLARPTGEVSRAFVGPIAAGEKVVKSRSSEVYKFLRANYGDVLAVEMEGGGFLRAARANLVDALVVRGISDLVTGKAKADAGGSQEIAALHAAAFAFEA